VNLFVISWYQYYQAISAIVLTRFLSSSPWYFQLWGLDHKTAWVSSPRCTCLVYTVVFFKMFCSFLFLDYGSVRPSTRRRMSSLLVAQQNKERFSVVRLVTCLWTTTRWRWTWTRRNAFGRSWKFKLLWPRARTTAILVIACRPARTFYSLTFVCDDRLA